MVFATIEEVWGTDFNKSNQVKKHDFSKIENNFNQQEDILFEYNKQTSGLPIPIAFNDKKQSFLVKAESKLFSTEDKVQHRAQNAKYESLIVENQQLRNKIQELEHEINNYKLLQNYLVYSLGGIILIYLFDNIRKSE